VRSRESNGGDPSPFYITTNPFSRRPGCPAPQSNSQSNSLVTRESGRRRRRYSRLASCIHTLSISAVESELWQRGEMTKTKLNRDGVAGSTPFSPALFCKVRVETQLPHSSQDACFSRPSFMPYRIRQSRRVRRKYFPLRRTSLARCNMSSSDHWWDGRSTAR
jgi:hypothetical protein